MQKSGFNPKVRLWTLFHYARLFSKGKVSQSEPLPQYLSNYDLRNTYIYTYTKSLGLFVKIQTPSSSQNLLVSGVYDYAYNIW